MHSTVVRAQNVFGFFTTVAFCVAALIAVSVLTFSQTPSASIKLRNIQVVRGRPHYYSTKKEEYAHIKFDLDADLSTLFNWNTKQVFLYITATYPSHKEGSLPSQAIIWDAIIAAPSAPWHLNHWVHPDPKSKRFSRSSKKQKSPFPLGEVHLHTQRPKYQITDYTGKMANRTDAVLELGWNVQPWVGALTWANRKDWGRWKALSGGESKIFNFPDRKGRKEAEDLGIARGGEYNRGKPA